MAKVTSHIAIVLDDGVCFVRCSGPTEWSSPAEVPGFLRRRCGVAAHTPDGYECIGRFDCDASGQWCASIEGRHSALTRHDTHDLGIFSTWVDAVYALWDHRHEALCSTEQA